MLMFEKTVLGSRYGSARPHVDIPRATADPDPRISSAAEQGLAAWPEPVD